MLATARSCDLTITFPQQRIITPYIDLILIAALCIVTTEIECIPYDPPGLPWSYILALLRESIGICRCNKRFISQDSRCCMMPMSALPGGGKSCDNDIRLEFSYHP